MSTFLHKTAWLFVGACLSVPAVVSAADAKAPEGWTAAFAAR